MMGMVWNRKLEVSGMGGMKWKRCLMGIFGMIMNPFVA